MHRGVQWSEPTPKAVTSEWWWAQAKARDRRVVVVPAGVPADTCDRREGVATAYAEAC